MVVAMVLFADDCEVVCEVSYAEDFRHAKIRLLAQDFFHIGIGTSVQHIFISFTLQNFLSLEGTLSRCAVNDNGG